MRPMQNLTNAGTINVNKSAHIWRVLSLMTLFFLGNWSILTVLAQIQPQLLVPTSSGFTRNLRIGDAGSDVSALQTFLIKNGFLSLAAPTGHFGAKTSG